MPTLVLTPRYTEDTQALWLASVRLGWRVERLTSWRVPEHLRSIEEPVLYAEALFGPTLGEQLGLTLTNPPDDWLARLPFEYRKRGVRLTTLEQARKLEVPAFVKPPNDKSFPASVYGPGELPTEYEDSMAVLVSDIVSWECELRCFILDRKLATFSLYSRYGELQRDSGFEHTAGEGAELEAFMAELLADGRVDLPRATVIDAGIISGQGWSVVEQNAAWGAGIYGCDPSACLEVIRHAAAAPPG
jgi:hypothetical protein